MKTIYVTGEINEESFSQFRAKINKYAPVGNIHIEIMSEGGDAYSAMAYYDLIKKQKSMFSVTATGLVASAATLIFMACTYRKMTQNAWLMVHEDSLAGIEDGMKVHQIEKEAKHGRRLEDQWCRLMLESCPTVSLQTWKNLHKDETYLNAGECLALGIIKEIV